jgi:hypothetical protein
VEKVWEATGKHELHLRGLTLQFAALDQLSDLKGLFKAGGRAVQVARKLSDHEQEWYALDLQGSTATRLSDFDTALSLLQEAVQVAHEHGRAELVSFVASGTESEMRSLRDDVPAS